MYKWILAVGVFLSGSMIFLEAREKAESCKYALTYGDAFVYEEE